MDTTKFDLSDPDARSFCPSCGAGYTARATRCADCDEELLPRSWVERQGQEEQKLDSGTAVALCQLDDRVKVTFLESRLQEEGIYFFVKELGASPAVLQSGLLSVFQILVLDQDLERAKAVLAELEDTDADALPSEDSA